MNITIYTIVGHLFSYIFLHSIIGWKFDKVKQELEEKPGNERLINITKKLKILFQWFPALYLIMIIIMFYFF